MIYPKLLAPTKKLAVLVDPDKHTPAGLQHLTGNSNGVDLFLVGGSLLMHGAIDETIRHLKERTQRPVVLFPGHRLQLSPRADALLLLSLLSGRNAEYLIGQHVASAPQIEASKIEVIPTAYLLVDGGRVSTTQYITQTQPIPSDRPDVAVATALAAKQLGMQLIYLEAGSGALKPVPPAMIEAVKKQVPLPLVVGGGIRNAAHANGALQAGADMIVVGNVLEQNPGVLDEIKEVVRSYNHHAA